MTPKTGPVEINDLRLPVDRTDSPPARRGDICVIVDWAGRYGVGEIIEVDSAGMATVVDCGDRNWHVNGLKKFFECRCCFYPMVHRAFGWCDTIDQVVERLAPHTRRPILPFNPQSKSRAA